jgi:hypothetical protein
MRRQREARHVAKYTGSTVLLARLLEVEGYVAEVAGARTAAADYLTRAAQGYLGLGRYRAAALASLHCLEMMRAAGEELPEQAAETAREAVGTMPPASRDVYNWLATLGLQPMAPRPSTNAGEEPAVAETVKETEGAQAQRELRALEETLAGHLKSGNAQGTAVALYRLGRWHMRHREPRAAVDYLIANAMLERLLELPMDDREDALNALEAVQKELPPGTVRAALAAAESGPPSMLAPLLGEVAPAR